MIIVLSVFCSLIGSVIFLWLSGLLGRLKRIETQVFLMSEDLTSINKLTKDITGKMEILWSFLMRRAISEAVQKGIAEVDTPIKIQ
jgi:hypothetical protein